MTEKFEKHLTADEEGVTAVSLLAKNTTLSHQQIKKTMTNGAVWLESKTGINRIRRGKKVLHKGDTLHLYYDSKIQSQTPDTAELIADEGDYSIWNKPYGMYSQGTKWGDHCTIYRWAESQLQRPSFLVHRLAGMARVLQNQPDRSHVPPLPGTFGIDHRTAALSL